MIKETKKGYPKTLRLQTDGSHSQVYRIKGRKECYGSPVRAGAEGPAAPQELWPSRGRFHSA